MVRRYGDPVVVRSVSDEPAGPASRPQAFLWRGRLYVVHEVLGHWRERRAWWASAAARAVHGDGAGDGGAVTVALHGHSTTTTALETEREVWRVEASRGRAFGSGVFDLCRDLPGDDEAWQLLRVSD